MDDTGPVIFSCGSVVCNVSGSGFNGESVLALFFTLSSFGLDIVKYFSEIGKEQISDRYLFSEIL
jgi:hypothetical protein